MTRPEISLTFPCYNEEANVGRMIEASLTALGRFSDRFEVIVSNDGSRDRTREIAESYAARYPDLVRVLSQVPNRGYGHALKVGLQAARYEWVFFTDGDCQFDLDEMERLVPFLTDHDIVTGFRKNRRDPFHRKLNAAGWNLLARLLLGIQVRDVNCAFRFLRKSFLDAVTLQSEGAFVNVEMYAYALRMGSRIKEVEVSHYPRTAGKQTGANVRVIVKAFVEMYRLRHRLRGKRGS